MNAASISRTTLTARCLMAGVLVACGAPFARAASKVTPEQQQFVDKVLTRLLSEVDRPEGYDAWPPTWRVIDDPEVQAFATLDEAQKPKKIPIIRVYRGFLEQVAQMDEDRAAFVLGHELSHLMCGHVLANEEHKKAGSMALLVFTRDQELQADSMGMQLSLKAGYSYKKGMDAIKRMLEISNYTSFEGMGYDHPSWAERIAAVETDESQAKLWRGMSAFETGVFLLQAQDWGHAEFCFNRVIKEFPKCYEAWANLGYAQLMEYCDQLTAEELKNFDIGHLVVGGFYSRPDSFGLRNIEDPEKKWWDAVGSLRQAIILRDDLVLAKANLALAYLVHPSGKPDVGQAAKLYQDVATLLKDEKIAGELDPLTRASLLSNAWVGVYHSDDQQGQAVMAQIDSFLRQAEQNARNKPGAEEVRAAIDYTRAMSLAKSAAGDEQRKALPLFEHYLSTIPKSSSWWELANRRYLELTKSLGVTPKSWEELKKPSNKTWRAVTSITTNLGKRVGVSDPDVLESLGAADETETVAGGGYVRLLKYKDQGVSIVADRKTVVAVVLNTPDAPKIQLRRQGLDTQPQDVYVGMPRAELEALLGDGFNATSTTLIDSQVRHSFYEDVGLAVRYSGDKVSELVVAVAPRGSSEK